MVNDPNSRASLDVVAEICVEYWKLARAASKAIDHLGGSQGGRLSAQIKYSERQLSVLCSKLDLKLICFEGEEVHAGISASADNEDEFSSEMELIVTKTLEPAVVRDMSVLRNGRVLVAPKFGEEG